MKNLEFILANIFPRLGIHSYDDRVPSEQPFITDDFEFCLKHAKAHQYDQQSFETLVWNAFVATPSQFPPSAVLAAKALGLPYRKDYWLRVTPVTLKADMAAVYLQDCVATITQEEQVLIENELRDLLKANGMTLHCVQPDFWLLQSEQPFNVDVHDPFQLRGKELSHVMPQGPDKARFERLLLEIQMVLHQSRVNQQRQAQHQPLINGLWLWGGGDCQSLQACTTKNIAYDLVLTDNSFVRGLADYFQQPNVLSLEYFTVDRMNNLPKDANVILISDGLRAPHTGNWQAGFTDLNNTIFSTLKILLQKRSIKRVTLATETGRYVLTSLDRLRFYRRIKSYESLSAAIHCTLQME